MSEKLKEITKDFQKYNYKRNIKLRNEVPHFLEIGIFLDKMYKKGYIPLANSITIRDISTPDSPPDYRIWGWFIKLGKYLKGVGCIKKDGTNILRPTTSYEFLGEALSQDVLSDEGKEFPLLVMYTRSEPYSAEIYKFSGVYKE